MAILIDWIEDRKKSTIVLTVFLIGCYLAPFIVRDVQWVAITALIGSIVCPFAIFLVWIVDSKWVDRLLARRWTAILFSGLIIIYGMFANTFAGSLLNEYFNVDPSHFPITRVFLTTVYLLVGVFQPFVLFPIWLAIVLLSSLLVAIPILVGSIKQIAKWIVLLFTASVLISASTQMLGLLRHRLPMLAERVALAADFNDEFLCAGDWAVRIDKVIFLYDGKVLGHIVGTRNYKVLPCKNVVHTP